VYLFGTIMRYLSTFIIASVLTVLLFLMMQRMLSFELQTKTSDSIVNGLDFVRLIRNPDPVAKIIRSKPPEKPQPPKKKPPPPKLQQLQVHKPKVNPLVMPTPRLQTKLNLNDALYLGSFHKQAPVQRIIQEGIPQGMQQEIQVDEEVVPLVRIAPIYPSRAARLNIQGWVKFEVLIDKEGSVKKVKVLNSHPSGIFNRAAIKAMKRWRFRPKVIDGIAVSRTAEQQINFKLQK